MTTMINFFNQSTNNTEQQQVGAPQERDLNNFIASCVVNAVFSFTALAGNGLVLGAIWKTPSQHSPSNFLLFGLALSDFCVGLILQPLYVTCLVVEIITKRYLLAVWTAYRVIQAVFVSATVLTITAVSVDRFLALRVHLRYLSVVTNKRTLIVLFLIWIASVAYDLTITINHHLHLSLCVVIVSSSLVVNTLVYLMIFQTARHHRNQIPDQTQIRGDETLKRKRQRKSATSMFMVFLLLCICYVTYLCVRIAVNLIAHWPISVVRLAHSWSGGRSGVLVYVNSSLNPLVYCWRMRDLRKAVKRFGQNHLARG